MILCDVNVLLAAFRADHPDHGGLRPWLTSILTGIEPVGVSDATLVAVVRLATSAHVFKRPSPLHEALAFTSAVRAAPRAIRVVEGELFFSVFQQLCTVTGSTGRSIPDAALAALAIESGAVFVTRDAGFVRFPRLMWMDPLDGTLRKNPAR